MKLKLLAALVLTQAATSVNADSNMNAINQADAIKSDVKKTAVAAFDILAAHAHRDGRIVTFHMTTKGTAGSKKTVAGRGVGWRTGAIICLADFTRSVCCRV